MFSCRSAALLALCLSLAFCAHAQDTGSPNSAQESSRDATPTGAPTVPDSTKLEIIKIEKALYPVQAQQQAIQGQVWVKMHVSETGDVESVDVISGDPILAKSAVSASKRWKFKPYIKNGKAIKVTTKIPFDFYFSDKIIEKGVSADGLATADSKLMNGSYATAPNADNHAAGSPNTENIPKRVPVSQGVSQGMLVRQVAPVYPPAARLNHVQGTVVLDAVIGKDGRISDLRAISGPKELIPAAMGAVEQWRYKPYILLGQPVEIETQITVHFML